ncbi:MAG: dihydroorotate dehydrogenase (quinone), partial [Parasphingopyxis sp.]
MALYPLFRPLVFLLDAEKAHRLTIRALRSAPLGNRAPPTLPIRVAGLDFPNPVGLAAGFDKDAEVFGKLPALGFGSTEIGTVTPLAQPGNPKPRLFRLAADRAVINRMGFNNAGQAAAKSRLAGRERARGIVGVNIGANKENAAGDAAIADYVAGVETMAAVADYLTVNISSPNTPGLRGLQDPGALDALLAAVIEARDATAERPPVFLKLAPDLEADDIDAIARVAIDRRA